MSNNSDIKSMIENIRRGKETIDKVVPVNESKPQPEQIENKVEPKLKEKGEKPKSQTTKKKSNNDAMAGIVERIKAFETPNNDFVLHNRVNEKTFKRVSMLKAATKIDTTKLVAFAIDFLFEQNPDLDQSIKNYFKS